MGNRSGSLEKEGTAFVGEKPSVPGGHSSLSQPAIMSTKQSGMDELLENTLLNVKLDKPLSKCEREILELIVSGKTNKKIAQKIYRTERTVEYHRHRLMRKLDAHTAVDLVKRAIAMGLV